MPSNVIRSFSFDNATRELTVRFMTGRTYVYFDVPSAVAAEMRRAFAKGEFFNREIRGHYRFARRVHEPTSG